MKLEFDSYLKTINFYDLNEIEKFKFLLFYKQYFEKDNSFSINELKEIFLRLGLPLPNITRLKLKIKKSKEFTIVEKDVYRLHGKTLLELSETFSSLKISDEIKSSDSILPIELYSNTSGFVSSIAKQINSSYENNIFDGCAVLMRRLIEVLLILSYQKQGIDHSIKDSNGNYSQLEKIISDAQKSKTLNLSRNTKASIELFRELGNFSAHHLYYLCKRTYIKESIPEFRVSIEELLRKSGLLK